MISKVDADVCSQNTVLLLFYLSGASTHKKKKKSVFVHGFITSICETKEGFYKTRYQTGKLSNRDINQFVM